MGLLQTLLSFNAAFMEWLKPELPPLFSKMTLIDKFLFLVIHMVDQHYPWYHLPVFLGLAYLEVRRGLHQRYSLINVGQAPISIRFNPSEIPYRTANGEFNDPFNSDAGEQGSFFGRNISPSPNYDNKKAKNSSLNDPHPTLVATKLLARKTLVDNGTQFNMLAAAWIQFMIHDWVDHEEDMNLPQVELVAPSSISSGCPLKSYKFHPTKQYSINNYDIQIGHKNIRTPWWDGSVIYGNNSKTLAKVRAFKEGKLILGDNGLLQINTEDGLPISGDIRNSWAGVSLLQVLFIKEHNAICDKIKSSHPNYSDEQLYRHARLVVAAVIAKVHTIDWTVELLKMDTLYAGLRANWYGILGKKFKDLFGHTGSQLLSGYVGMPKPQNHGVPYSLTEDFVGVYRMHSLLPDSITLRNIKKTASKATKVPQMESEIPIANLIHAEGEKLFAKVGFDALLVSMGHQSSGALTLWNYPTWMRELIPQDVDTKDRENPVDLPSLEIYRDRERHVPRYNEFRRKLLMVPIKSWKDLTDDADAIATLHEVYGNNVELLDLLVGLMAEKKIKGYAISETAFHIFLLMASRRLEGDRFFTSDFNAEVYTKEGLDWVNNTESLKDVLARHHKEITDQWLNPNISAFSVWSANTPSKNLVPLLFRIP
ncbi:hypothetical protein GOP47_0000561 [Adiantum capillus-veneris]|uniref:Uncharacterized protein n=1 Tax=Adiantum capillus-veneris TaxID=13818 RepID=A0A9D4VDS3_ADICA|nr:hypothetical protein GOP47_0000561 [Adiantum capillus-veneris]